MRTSWFVALGAALLIVLAPYDAGAVDGTITGVTATPNPADVNQDVVITVLGTQKCKKVGIDFGDNSTPGILNNPDFENNDVDEDSASHPYNADGLYVVYVYPVEQCSGSAQMNVTVGTGGGNGGGNGDGNGGSDDKIPAKWKWKGKDPLCGLLANCPGEEAMRPDAYRVQLPHLEALFPFSVIEPGGDVIVLGQQFGKTQGELHMVLKTDNKDVKLQVKEWSDGHVGGTIPSYTIGVVDQKAEFYVKSSNGLESDRLGDASFTARRGLEILPRSDVSLVQCGFDSNCDHCLGTYDPDDLDDHCKVSSPHTTGTVTGFHMRDFMTVGNAKGIDIYKLKTPLKNGWKMDKVVIDWWPEPGEKSATPSITSSQIKLDWWLTPHDSFWYDLYVTIKGPMGTPH